ncbi:MAG: hypothetical protein E6Z41_05300 [Cutibacterium avidum]|nr:hypothetical protein [Cutibacterium avidum]
MSVSVYNPEGIETIENSKVMIVPSIAKLDAATVTELNAGTAITCALKSFETSSDASESEDKRICRRNASKRPGPVTYGISDTDIVITDPQKEDKLIAGLEPGSHWIVVEFPAIEPEADVAAGQKYYAWKATVKTKTPGKLTTDDGEMFTMNIGWSVSDRTLNGAVTA